MSLISSLASALSTTFLVFNFFPPPVVEKQKVLVIFSSSTVHSENSFGVEL